MAWIEFGCRTDLKNDVVQGIPNQHKKSAVFLSAYAVLPISGNLLSFCAQCNSDFLRLYNEENPES